MIIRNKSAPKLTTSLVKQKVKQTIRIAMGRSPQKEKRVSVQNNRTHRSSSTRSLQMFNRKISAIPNDRKRGLQISTEDIMKKINIAQMRSDLSDITNKSQAIEYKWWHCNGFQLKTESKSVKRAERSILLQYFAIQAFSKQSSVIVAIEDEVLHMGQLQLSTYLINGRNKTYEQLNSKLEHIDLKGKELTEMLVIKHKDVADLKSEKSIGSGIKSHPKIEQILQNYLNSSELYAKITKEHQDIQYILLFSLANRTNNKASMIMKQVKAHLNAKQQESARKFQAKGIAGKNINLAEHMLTKYKKN